RGTAGGLGWRGHVGPRRAAPVRGEGVVARGGEAVQVADGPGVVRAARGDAEQALVYADDVRRRGLLPLRAVPPLGEDLRARVLAGPREQADGPGVGGGTRGDGVKGRDGRGDAGYYRPGRRGRHGRAGEQGE